MSSSTKPQNDITRTQLVRATNKFFDLHWPDGEQRPAWSDSLYTGTGHVPFGHLPGCYAIVRGGSIRYIGSGVARCNDRYPNYGLAARTHNYLRRDFHASKKHPEKTPIWTLRDPHDEGLYCVGFPASRSYLVVSLEFYLTDAFCERLHNKRRISLVGR